MYSDGKLSKVQNFNIKLKYLLEKFLEELNFEAPGFLINPPMALKQENKKIKNGCKLAHTNIRNFNRPATNNIVNRKKSQQKKLSDWPKRGPLTLGHV